MQQSQRHKICTASCMCDIRLAYCSMMTGWEPNCCVRRCSKYQGGKALEVAFVGYRDYEDHALLEVVNFTGDLDSFKARVSAIRARGGELRFITFHPFCSRWTPHSACATSYLKRHMIRQVSCPVSGCKPHNVPSRRLLHTGVQFV
jgi:hypothetical protein